MTGEQEYISGLGKDSAVPPEIKKWNWGAFLLNWIWGIGNGTFIALLMFVPLVNIIMPFVLGAKGSKWAWQKRTWRDIEHFKNTQRKWAISGLVFWFILIPALLFSVGGLLKNNDVYKISLSTVQENPSVIEVIGSPIESGFFVTGSIQTSGPNGSAALQYTVKGPRGEGETYVIANKEMEKWVIRELVVYFEEIDKRIDIIIPPK